MQHNTQMPIFDGHNDVLLKLYLEERGTGYDFFQRNTDGHFDLPRAQDGGFAGGFFAIFVPNPSNATSAPQDDLEFTEQGYRVRYAGAVDPDYARHFTMAVMARLFRLEAAAAGRVKVVRTVDDIQECIRTGVLAIVLHFEGAESIDTNFDNLEVFYQAGLRSLGPVWSRPNAFGHGVPFEFPHTPDIGPGLTEVGRELVRQCNRLGILIDLAHLNEQGFFDVARLSRAPLVATHTAAYALCHSTRNLTDRQLDAIKDSDGLVGLNFEVANLREDAYQNEDTPISLMVRHIDYLVEHVGIERVAFGSDFDGGITLVHELGDVAGLPNLVAALSKNGYNDDAIRKLTHENWLRVLRQTWQSL
jgi:membrane dipeptidase